MKRLVLIVPDTITHSISSFSMTCSQKIPVTGQCMIQALELDAYDENYFFPEGSVRVESIEDSTGSASQD
jgi:hypothetical protein